MTYISADAIRNRCTGSVIQHRKKIEKLEFIVYILMRYNLFLHENKQYSREEYDGSPGVQVSRIRDHLINDY